MNGLSVNIFRQIDYLSKSNTASSRAFQSWLPKQVRRYKATGVWQPHWVTTPEPYLTAVVLIHVLDVLKYLACAWRHFPWTPRNLPVGTCESFFSFESNLESNRPADSFSNRIFESNRPYTTQAVTQPNGLQAYRRACYTYSKYLIHRYFVFVTNESDVRTTELRTEYLFISIQS